METKKKIDMELNFIYNSNQIKERQAYSYAISLGKHKINEVDVYKNQLTERQLADVAKKLDVKIRDLLDTTSQIYKDTVEDGDFDDQNLLKLIKENPSLLNTPILENQGSAVFIKSPFDLNKVDMSFQDIAENLSNKDEK